MSKLAFLTIAVLTAAILSLSAIMMTQASFASGDPVKSAHDAFGRGASPTSHPTDVGTEPKKVQSAGDSIIGSSSHHHGKIGKINGLFRSNSIETGSSALDNIPVIPKMNFDTVNGTNNTSPKTATVTIPICDGIVPGPCLDKTTGQITP